VGGEEVKTTSNVQRPTSNIELPEAGFSSFRRILWRVVAIVIGGIFIYAGAVKIVDPAEFARDIDNYKMLPWQMSVALGFYLPWVEILCGLALIVRVLYGGGVFILTALTLVFIAITIIAKARGLDISCGCFGHASKYLSFAWHLVLDFLLLGGLLLLWRRSIPAP
jgi:hypothetical protein